MIACAIQSMQELRDFSRKVQYEGINLENFIIRHQSAKKWTIYPFLNSILQQNDNDQVGDEDPLAD